MGTTAEIAENKNKIVLEYQNCPIRNVLDRFGDKWSILVLLLLGSNGTMRFTEISKSIKDVSQKMLTTTLRTLESDGLVARKIYAVVPPRVEYKLTPMGKSLIPLINNLVKWGAKNMKTILASRNNIKSNA